MWSLLDWDSFDSAILESSESNRYGTIENWHLQKGQLGMFGVANRTQIYAQTSTDFLVTDNTNTNTITNIT